MLSKCSAQTQLILHQKAQDMACLTCRMRLTRLIHFSRHRKWPFGLDSDRFSSILLQLEGRLGSPTPRWHRPSAEELELLQENPTDGKPSIRVTPYVDQEGNSGHGKRFDSLRFDLRNDPIFKEDNDLLYKVQRRNSIKTLGIEQKANPFANINARKNNLKNVNANMNAELEEQRCQPVKSKNESLEGKLKKSYILPEKTLHLPSRYAPLKPIGQQSADEFSSGWTQTATSSPVSASISVLLKNKNRLTFPRRNWCHARLLFKN